jgi:hypothetical protein
MPLFRNRACGLLDEKIFELNSRQKIGNRLRCSASALLRYGNHWRSLGDSNPCFRRERATSWAARRREQRRSSGDSADQRRAQGEPAGPLICAGASLSESCRGSPLPGIARRKTRVSALMTRQFIISAKNVVRRKMDPRVKPGGDSVWTGVTQRGWGNSLAPRASPPLTARSQSAADRWA